MKKGESKVKNEKIMSTLGEGTKQKLADCKTQEEMMQILAESGVEPLDDELLDAVAGGLRGPLEEQRGCRSFHRP